jgi:diguanylate cyclase (GGDEF)-like protein
MTVEKTSSVRPTRRVGIAAYAKQAQAAAAEGVAPVSASASVLGIPEEEFTPRVRDAIMALMSEVEALRRELKETKQRLEDTEKTADQDQLVPLMGRRAFVRELMRSISFAGRYGTPATLVYFDLDDFKKINDTYGHMAGDAVLMHVADTLLAHVRDSDTVARLGGDEFGVILSHAELAQGQAKADQLAAALGKSPPIWKGKAIATSFSYGTFELKAGDSADDAIARADEAMYAHKRR